MTKPIAFNYQKYVDALDEIKQLRKENEQLKNKLKQTENILRITQGIAIDSINDMAGGGF